ncbi:PAS domain-containing protein [Hyphomicrobium sp.]|uniref:PAS domain-containing protein n=1 Tax=Hyphomicrobium sp. TaxID=82 RepID=UPI002D79854F|nr:PAS domain-containing protein [Hyphomicrobium sp.]HET6388179.1 PAS domain-containing protein [Hyphomicrobium sp.]
MKEAVSQSLFTYWNDLRGDRPAPRRFEIEPSAIAHHLPDTFILERVDYATLRFRLAGTRISEAFGMDLRGKDFLDLFDEEDRQTLQSQIGLITSKAAVGVFEISADDGQGHGALFEATLMPLTHTRDAVERYLGSIVPIGAPQWLGLVPLKHRTLVRHKLIWPDKETPGDTDIVDRQTPFGPAVREARIVRSARRQFRVYEGGLSRAHVER